MSCSSMYRWKLQIGSAQMSIRIQSITFDPPHFHMSTQISNPSHSPSPSPLPRISPDRALVLRKRTPSHSTPKTGQTLPEKQMSEGSSSQENNGRSHMQVTPAPLRRNGKPSKTTRSKGKIRHFRMRPLATTQYLSLHPQHHDALCW